MGETQSERDRVRKRESFKRAMDARFATLFVLLGTVLLSGADARTADTQEVAPIQQQLREILTGLASSLRESLVPLLDRMGELSKRYSADVQELVAAARPHAARALTLAQDGARDVTAYAERVAQEAQERGPAIATQAQRIFQEMLAQVQDNKHLQKTRKYLEQIRQE
ncbi:uncharacterized protein LOC144728563 isoform X1 [Lampetra planeri]